MEGGLDDGGMVAVCLEVGVGGGDKDDFLVGFAVAALFPLLAPAEDFFLGADATPSPAKNSSLSSLFAFDDVLPFVLPDALRFSLFAFVSRSFSFLASCVCVCVCVVTEVGVNESILLASFFHKLKQ